MFLDVIKKGNTNAPCFAFDFNIYLWSTAYLDKHQCLPSHQMRIHYSAEYLTQCRTFICITTQQGWFMKSSPVTCMQKSFICNGAMHIKKNEWERDIRLSAAERWEDSKGWVREQAACFILYISCFSPSVPLLRCGGWWIMLYWWISPLSFSYSQCTSGDAAATQQKDTARRCIMGVCVMRVFIFAYLHFIKHAFAEHEKWFMLLHFDNETERPTVMVGREHTQKQQEHNKMRTWKWAEHTHSINTTPVE